MMRTGGAGKSVLLYCAHVHEAHLHLRPAQCEQSTIEGYHRRQCNEDGQQRVQHLQPYYS